MGLRFFSLLLLIFAAFSLAACGGSGSAPKLANVKPGNMPSGASWRGVYYSPNYGSLHLVQEGSLIQGRWQRPVKGRWGKLQGNVKGNLLKFDWEEFVDGLVGPGARKGGKGYFLYTRPEGENVDDMLVGEIGRGEDEVGEPEWRAVKQRNTEPKIDTIGGAGAADVKGGDWDTDNVESGTPEPPAPPDKGKPDKDSDEEGDL